MKTQRSYIKPKVKSKKLKTILYRSSKHNFDSFDNLINFDVYAASGSGTCSKVR